MNAGTTATRMTRLPYFLSYMRQIDSVQHRLSDKLAPKYVDVIEDHKMRMVDRDKAARLQSIKVPFHERK